MLIESGPTRVYRILVPNMFLTHIQNLLMISLSVSLVKFLNAKLSTPLSFISAENETIYLIVKAENFMLCLKSAFLMASSVSEKKTCSTAFQTMPEAISSG